MTRGAPALLAWFVAVAAMAAEGTGSLIEELLRVPVGRAPGVAAAKMLTGDEAIDTIASLVVTQSPLVTDAVRARVVARLAAEPRILPRALLVLPKTDAAAAAAWEAFQKLPARRTSSPEFEKVREWLRRHGNHLRGELVKAARNASDKEGWVAGREDLEAYARLDWKEAEPLLTRFAAAPPPRLAALAHALLYAHHLVHDPAAAGRERAVLRAIAEDRSAPGAARDIAFESLLRHEWDGRDEWYLAQFVDPTLFALRDGYHGLLPLASPVWRDPDFWIPRLVPLTRSSDPVVRANAIAILSRFHLAQARADALRPLLPWLADPGWTEDRYLGRLRLVQSVAGLGLTEAIPGLRWICHNDPDESMRVHAARALLEIQAPDAMPDVRAVLAKSTTGLGRTELETTLVDSGALTDEEMVETVTAYANAVSSDEGRKLLEESMIAINARPSWRVTVGARLARQLPNRDTVARRLLEAAARGDEAGRILGRIVSRMDVPVVHRWLAARLLEEGVASGDPMPIVSLLEHRTGAAQSAGDVLQAAMAKGGVARGIAAVVLNDASAISAILRNGTADERGAALAAARLVRQPLDVAEVLEAAANAKEAAAAELAMMNTAAARAALGTLYPGEARIWGPRPSNDPGHDTYSSFDAWEEKLRALQKKRKFDRIDALYRASYWGGNGEIVVVARIGNAMQLVSTESPSKSTPLPKATAARIRELLDALQPADLDPFDEGSADGTQYEYVYLTADGGRRVFMNNPSSDERDPYGGLVEALGGVAPK